MASRAEGFSRREVALAIPGLGLLGLGAGLARPAGGAYSTAILLRHAEKDAASDPADPGLSAAGLERARELARLLGRAGATHLVASEFRRTKETLGPLAEARSLAVETLPAADVARVAERIRKLPQGSVAVVAGHSNTVPAIAKALGGPAGPDFKDDEYGRLLVLTLRAGEEGGSPPETVVLELAYGA